MKIKIANGRGSMRENQFGATILIFLQSSRVIYRLVDRKQRG